LPPALLELATPLELLASLLELTDPLELLPALELGKLELEPPDMLLEELVVILGVLGKLRDFDVGTVMTTIIAINITVMPTTMAPCAIADWLRTCVRVRLVSIFSFSLILARDPEKENTTPLNKGKRIKSVEILPGIFLYCRRNVSR